jgi:predicted XRE-type DNA-binding protein
MKLTKVSKTPPPGWPSEKEWARLDKLLEKPPGSRLLPPNATAVERAKYNLCREFVIYLQEKKMTQRDLAKKLKTTEARISEIVHYHLDKVTTDRLVGYLGVIRPEFTLKVG